MVPKTCSHCGVEFKIKRYRDNETTKNWFCCKEHQSAFYVGKKAANPRPRTRFAKKVCDHCDHEFEYWIGDEERKYCSQKCAKEASKTGVVVKCKLCEKEFYKTADQQNDFCCKEHWDEWRVLARPKTICSACGGEFTQPGPGGKAEYCSRGCRLNHRNQGMDCPTNSRLIVTSSSKSQASVLRRSL